MASMVAPSVARWLGPPSSEATPGSPTEQAAVRTPAATVIAAARTCVRVGAAATSTTSPISPAAIAPRE